MFLPPPSSADPNWVPKLTPALAHGVSSTDLLFELLIYPHVSTQFLLQSLNSSLILPLAVC